MSISGGDGGSAARRATLPHAAPSVGAPSLEVPLLRVSSRSRWDCLCFRPRSGWKGRWASVFAVGLSSSAVARLPFGSRRSCLFVPHAVPLLGVPAMVTDLKLQVRHALGLALLTPIIKVGDAALLERNPGYICRAPDYGELSELSQHATRYMGAERRAYLKPKR